MWHYILGNCALEVNRLCECGVGFFSCDVMSLFRTGTLHFGNVSGRNALPAELIPASKERHIRGGHLQS